MDILFAIVGVLVGGGLGYWWRGRSIVRPLSSNAVWLFSHPKAPNLWRVELEEQHLLQGSEPTLWTLPHHEHSFSLTGKHAISCQDFERIDIECLVQVRPKRNKELLESLLAQSTLDDLNTVKKVFEQLQSTLNASTTVCKLEPRQTWLDNPHLLTKHWSQRLDESLPHWDCQITIEHLKPTPDQFYNDTVPEERALLLKRSQKHEQLQDLENQLQQVEEHIQTIVERTEQERQKQALLEANIAQTEERQIKWDAFEAHLEKQRARIERDIHESIEAFRTNMRSQLGLVTEELTTELGQRKPPVEIVDTETDVRNRLDANLDSHKLDHIESMTQVDTPKDSDLEQPT